MKYAIEHLISLAFPGPVREHHAELRVVPREDASQVPSALAVDVEPPSQVRIHLDCFGNRVDAFDITPPHEAVVVRLRVEVETRLANPFDYTPVPPDRERAWIEQVVRRQPALLDYVLHHGERTPGGETASALFAEAPAWDTPVALIEAVSAARDWVARRIEVQDGAVSPHLTLAAAMKEGRGCAEDLAHALVSLVRSWGVPARFVRGCRDADEESETEAGAHCWAEVLVPGAGWRGFDPDSGLVVNDRFIAVAVGRDAADAPLLRQVFKGEESAETETSRLRVSRLGQQQ